MKAIFISVRTGSTRLPNKALKEINGKPTIEYLIDMVKQSNYTNNIILCTTHLPEDDVLCRIALKNGIKYYKGSVEDKLDRWLGACKEYNIDFFVNVDGDDIFFDADMADACFIQHDKHDPDFIDGQGLYNDVYAMKTSALELACRIKTDSETEHVKQFFEDKIGITVQKILNGEPIPEKWIKKKMRLTLDYIEDLLFFKKVIENVKQLNFANILKYIEDNPSIVDINWSRDEDWKINQEMQRSKK